MGRPLLRLSKAHSFLSAAAVVLLLVAASVEECNGDGGGHPRATTTSGFVHTPVLCRSPWAVVEYLILTLSN